MILNLAHRSSKVIDFSANRKRVYILLLVVSCNISEIRQLKCRKSTIFPTPLLFRLKFEVFLWSRSVMLGPQRVKRLGVKLFSKNSNLYDHDTSTLQRDGQTDRQTTCYGNAALCVASRGKNCLTSCYHDYSYTNLTFLTSSTSKRSFLDSVRLSVSTNLTNTGMPL